MPSMEEQFETACEDGTIPGVILLASNRSGGLSALRISGLQLTEHQVHSTTPTRSASDPLIPTNRSK